MGKRCQDLLSALHRSGRRTVRGRSGPVEDLWTCGASVVSGILTFNRLVNRGSSRLASGVGSGLTSDRSLE